jgi:hypothetical protein
LNNLPSLTSWYLKIIEKKLGHNTLTIK